MALGRAATLLLQPGGGARHESRNVLWIQELADLHLRRAKGQSKAGMYSVLCYLRICRSVVGAAGRGSLLPEAIETAGRAPQDITHYHDMAWNQQIVNFTQNRSEKDAF